MASSAPATSSNVTLGVSGEMSLALERPNWKARLPPLWRLRTNQIQIPAMRIQGRNANTLSMTGVLAGLASMSTLRAWSSSSSSSVISPGSMQTKRLMSSPSRLTGVRSSPSTLRPSTIVTWRMFPDANCSRNWV